MFLPTFKVGSNTQRANKALNRELSQKKDVVSFCYDLKTTNPRIRITRKIELVSIRVNVTLD